MTTTTVYSGTSDGYIQSQSATYSLARAGAGFAAADAVNAMYVGQYASGDSFCLECFLSFDTSSLPDTDTVSAAELSLYTDADASTTDFTVNARAFDWGASLTSADWVAGDDLSSKTLLATFASASIGAAYNAFTSDANFPGAINKTGTTFIFCSSSRMQAGNAPTGLEYVGFKTADNSGTTNDPKLVITHDAAGGDHPATKRFGGVAFSGYRAPMQGIQRWIKRQSGLSVPAYAGRAA